MSAYDFINLPDRRDTGSIKWERYEGRDVLPMWVADMDFRSPPEIEAALQNRVAHGVYGYTDPTTEATQAVCQYMQDVHGCDIDETWLLWTPGLVPALNTAARAFCDKGQEVITTVPIYPPFLTAPRYQDRELVSVELSNENGFYTFDWDALEKSVTSNTKVFFLCNPHNPVGRVWAMDELQRVVDFCKRHQLVLVSDEIHCDLILNPDQQHHTALQIDPWVKDHGVTLMAPSKTYNLCGLACSFVVIPDDSLRRKFRRSMRGLFNELNCLGYAACAAAYRYGGPWRLELLDVLRENFAEILRFTDKSMPLIKVSPLQATYLAWLDIRALKLHHPRTHFERRGVGLNDGTEFGVPGFVRLNFGCPRARLQEALQRIKTAYDDALKDVS